MTPKLVMLAVMAATAAPVSDRVQLPDYGSGYRLDAALNPILPICAGALDAELRGGSFEASIDQATQDWPANRVWRVREICTSFRAGAVTMWIATMLEMQERQRRQQAPRPAPVA